MPKDLADHGSNSELALTRKGFIFPFKILHSASVGLTRASTGMMSVS